MDQYLCEIGIDMPVTRLIGIGQRAAGHGTGTEAQVVKLLRHRAQAGFDVPQALAIRELREGHAEKLIPAGEVAYPLVAAVAPDQSTEGVPGHVIHELHEHRPSLEHSWLLWLGCDRMAWQETEFKSMTGMCRI
jgi:hypothetical protein